MMNLYDEEWKMFCNISSTELAFNWIMYVDGEKSYIEEHRGNNNESNSLYLLSTDWKTYVRNLDWKWTIYESKNITSDLLKSFEEDKTMNYECSASTKWYKFEIPSDIEFVQHN